MLFETVHVHVRPYPPFPTTHYVCQYTNKPINQLLPIIGRQLTGDKNFVGVQHYYKLHWVNFIVQLDPPTLWPAPPSLLRLFCHIYVHTCY